MTLRANGVNTPIEVYDDKGAAQLPLLVQYPVEKGGRYIETAYYMSTHPGLITPEVVSAGRFYVHNVIEIAREQLKVKGYFIQPRSPTSPNGWRRSSTSIISGFGRSRRRISSTIFSHFTP